MSSVPSIGDSPTIPLKKVQESFPLPKTRKEVVAAFERILNLGGVHRVVVELGAPIKVVRVAEAGAEVPEELQDDDLVSAARNAPMEEFVFSENILPTNYLFRAFHLLTQRRLKATSMVVNSYASMKEWLAVDKTFDVSEVFGIPVKTHKEIPDGVLLVVAAPLDDPEVVTFSLRLEMSQEKKT
jgi:hypothetical protein